MASTASDFSGPRWYDEQLVPVTFGAFAGELAARVPPAPAGPVLEIACGTGVVTRALRQRLGAACALVATDLSPAMLDYARERLRDHSNVTWQVADMQRLPFSDGRFAAVVCSFGFMFASDRAAALAEARRVLAQDGTLCFSVWDRIEANPHALAFAELMEGMFPDDPQMRFRTPYEMHDAAQLRTLVEAAGFREVAVEVQRKPIAGVDPAALASGQIRGTPRGALLVERGVSLERTVDDLTAALVRQGGSPYQGQAQALLVQARAG